MPDPLVSLLIAAALAAAIYGLLRFLPRWQRSWNRTERMLCEDALKHIHKFEMAGQQPTLESTAGALNVDLDQTAQLIERMERNRFLQIQQGVIRLSPRGRETALHVIRAHRLWERYLADETGYAEADWHDQAERREHSMTPADADSLAARLGNPTYDPHGDPIPTAEGEIVDPGGQPLCSLPVDERATIIHLEDEPAVVYAQVLAEGLYLGMTVRVMESTPERVRFWADGNEHVIAPIVAMNISVKPLPAEAVEEPAPSGKELLSSLEPGELAEVASITRTCRGAERRRFMDLGILPGTRIAAEMRSPVGDPTAYRIRGTLIALRCEQAAMIQIRRTVP
ncbi:MAG: DtxR family transcriptional regulator [Pirellulales bacterium]